jgi:hypothetical protein
VEWATAQQHLGRALAALGRVKAESSLQLKSVQAFQSAQALFDPQELPGCGRRAQDEIDPIPGAPP